MVERDVVVAKIATIERCLKRIADVRGARRVTLLPTDVDDIVLLNLQRAVQAAIDLASHVVSSEGYGVPDSVAGVFSLLERQGVIEPSLAERLRRMVGFRNVAVHEYQTLDPAVVEAIATRHLSDLELLCTSIVRRFGL